MLDLVPRLGWHWQTSPLDRRRAARPTLPVARRHSPRADCAPGGSHRSIAARFRPAGAFAHPALREERAREYRTRRPWRARLRTSHRHQARQALAAHLQERQLFTARLPVGQRWDAVSRVWIEPDLWRRNSHWKSAEPNGAQRSLGLNSKANPRRNQSVNNLGRHQRIGPVFKRLADFRHAVVVDRRF